MILFLILLYLLVSMRTMIGHFRGPYSPVRTAKMLSWFCCKTVLWIIMKITISSIVIGLKNSRPIFH